MRRVFQKIYRERAQLRASDPQLPNNLCSVYACMHASVEGSTRRGASAGPEGSAALLLPSYHVGEVPR